MLKKNAWTLASFVFGLPALALAIMIVLHLVEKSRSPLQALGMTMLFLFVLGCVVALAATVLHLLGRRLDERGDSTDSIGV